MSKTKKGIIIVGLLVVVSAVIAYQSIQLLKEGTQAYLFGYSLVLMDTTRQSMIHPDHGQAPINHFYHVGIFPDHTDKQVVRPNNDTLYSTAWLDLTAEPLILSVPDTKGRYYVMPFMDAWTNVFASVGKRTTSTAAGNYLVAGPNWLGQVPPDTKLIRSPTNITWLIGRIQTDGKKDYDNVRQIQKQIKLTPFSRWKKGEANQAFVSANTRSTIVTDNPSAQVEQMTAGEFFAELSELMENSPPAKADEPMLETLAEFGIVAGKPFDINNLNFFRRLLLEKSVSLARKKMQELTNSDRSTENYWSVIRNGIGVYETNYRVRAFVSRVGLGALEPEEAAYPMAQKDGEGRPLDGRHQYRIHFNPGKTPPVKAFWSLTVYNKKNFLAENPINRYSISDRDHLTFNNDGSLDILIQHQQPRQGMSNWLPTPADIFSVNLRLYMPKPEFLDGRWKLPPIERIEQVL